MNTETVAKLKGELTTLKSKVAFLEEITENAIHVEEHNGNYIVVKPECLEMDIICWGGVHVTTRLDGLEFDVEDDLDVNHNDNVVADFKEQGCTYLPVYVFRHSGTRVSTTPFSCKWDSGLAGYIYMTKEEREDNGWDEEQCKKHLEYIIDCIDKNYNDELYSVIVRSETDYCTVGQGFFEENENSILDCVKEAKCMIDDDQLP